MASFKDGEEEAASRLGSRLRAAREAEGLSRDELASKMGVARVTVREAEGGRDSRHSTLQAYVDALPGITPTLVLPEALGRKPSPSLALREFHRSVFPLSVSRLQHVLEVHADGSTSATTTLTGIKGRNADLDNPHVRADLMRAACQASSRVLARLGGADVDVGARLVELDDGPVTHSFRFPRGVRRFGFSYVRTRSRPPGSVDMLRQPEVTTVAACLEVDSVITVHHPTEELEMVIRHARGLSETRPTCMSWPAPLVGEVDRTPSGASVSRSARSMKAQIRHPLIGLAYGLGWTAESGTNDPACVRDGADSEADSRPVLGEVIELARRAAGLSQRDLGRNMGVSHVTVREVERGRDVRRSTLGLLARELTELSSWSLLPPASMERSDAWAYYRDLYGVEAAEESKSVRITAKGDTKIDIGVRGLQRLRHSSSPMLIRLGSARTVLQESKASLVAMDLARDVESTIRIGTVVGQDGLAFHQVSIPSELARSGTSFDRRLVHAGAFVMDARRARELTGETGPFEAGTSFHPTIPTRRLRLIVRFPRGYWPEAIACHVWSVAQVPDPDLVSDISERLHPDGLDLVLDRAEGTASLLIEYPLMGAKYALGWRLPEVQGAGRT